MPKKTPIQAEDIYEVRMPTCCRLSPDGSQAIVGVYRQDRETYRSFGNLWTIATEPSLEPTSAHLAGSAGRASSGNQAAKKRAEVERIAVQPLTTGDLRDSQPKWSPDGSAIAFLSSRSGKSEVWIIPTAGGEARQITKLNGSISDFDWHPKGKRLVISFIAEDDDAKAKREAKKQGRPGTDSPTVRAIDRLVYKIDGAGFLPKNRSHLWTVDIESGKARALTTDDAYEESEPRFSPDGRWVYFVSNRSAKSDLEIMNTDLWRVPARGGDVEKIRTHGGSAGSFAISPNGEWITFLGSPDAAAPWNQFHTKLYLVSATGGRAVELGERLDRGCGDSMVADTVGPWSGAASMWSPDSEWVYFVVSNEGNTELWRVHRQDKKPEPVIASQGAVIDFDVDFERSQVHYTWADVSTPGEFRTAALPEHERAGRKPRGRRDATSPTHDSGAAPQKRYSPWNQGWLSQRRFNIPEEVWFENKGHRVQGWVLTPPGLNRSRKHPGLLYIHGGPAAQYGHVFFHEFQVLAAKGYTVFYCNPRGGTGYSEKHLNAIVGRWGTVDYDDVMRFTDVVLRRYKFLDRTRIGVAGGSYGGYMTNWIIGHTQRFKCAVTQRCISNWLSFIGASDFGWAWTRNWGYTNPWENPQKYLKASPLTYLKNIKTPTLVEHQEQDHRCPIDQGEQFWSALKAKGVPTEFVRYPAEPHGMSRMGRPDRRIDRIERIVQWLDRWLRR